MRMFGRVLREAGRRFSTSGGRYLKVTVCGAGGRTGQPLSMILKRMPYVDDLRIYDVMEAIKGVAADLSHIDTRAVVRGFTGPAELADSLRGAQLVLVLSGVSRTPGISRMSLFKTNASIVETIMKVAGQVAPTAVYAIVTNPVNSMVPLASEVLKLAGAYDPNKVFGVTTIDVVRARILLREMKDKDLDRTPLKISVPVIGGHSGQTTIPVISQVRPAVRLEQYQLEQLVQHIQHAAAEVIAIKAGSACLSTAHATARFAESLCRAMSGEKFITECAYVKSRASSAPYFATRLVLGKNGIERNLGIGRISRFEEKLVKIAEPILKKEIKLGVDYAKKVKK